jgi:hypothetical protein
MLDQLIQNLGLGGIVGGITFCVLLFLVIKSMVTSGNNSDKGEPKK